MITRPLSLDLERLRRLPPGNDVWQVAVRVAPQWIVPDEDDKDAPAPYRPLIAVCLSIETGLVAPGGVELPDAPHADLALSAVAALGATRGIGARPAVVEVNDPALVAALGPPLADVGIAVRHVAKLNEIDKFLVEMRHAIGDGDASLYEPDVPIALLGVFAMAAREFEAAAPWNHLANDDLVHVETRGAPEGMRWFAIMGAAGMRQGIAFFSSRSEFVEIMESRGTSERLLQVPRWSVTFDDPHLLPIVDFERWEERGLPRTAGGRIPVLAQMSLHGDGKPASAARLDFAAALLSMLATTTEDELDEGRWSRVLPGAAGGEQTITLALPELLEAESPKRAGKRPLLAPGEMPDRRLMEREMAKIGRLMAGREWESPEEFDKFLAGLRGKSLPAARAAGANEEAQELFYAALEASGRRRIKLARQAVQRDPDCADALVLLAEHMPDPDRARALYRIAMEAGERALGPAAFVEHRGHFWGVPSTRPYMRARRGLAEHLWLAGQPDAAIAHWREMLELNPGDNQGVRYEIIPRLLELGRDAEASAVLAAHGDEDTGMMNFAAALLAFRLHGKGPESSRRLAAALRANAHAVKYLLDPDSLPDGLPSAYAHGSDEEAIILADNLVDAWHATPGALEWLREARREAKKLREIKRKKRGR